MKEQNALPQSARSQMAREQRMDAGVHPDADVLTAFCEGALGEVERTRVMEHIARCSECREVVFLVAPEIETTAAAPVTATAPIVVHWWRRWMPAMAAAAAVIVVGSAILVSRSTRTETQISTFIEPPKSQAENAPTQSSGDIPAVTAKLRSQNESPSRGPQKSATPSVDKKNAAPQVRARAVPCGDGCANQQATAPSAHGTLLAKGSSTNYQNLPVTSQANPAVPTAAGKYGPVEAAGNAFNYAQSIPGSTKPESGHVAGALVSAAAPSPAPPQMAQADKLTSSNTTVVTRTLNHSAELAKAKNSVAPSTLEVASRAAHARAHWRISDAGQLQRKFGNGEWSSVLGDASVGFRVVSVTGDDVWAGGTAGTLYHSTDAGQHWSRTAVQGVTEAITEVRFQNAANGSIKTESGVMWQTLDGGAHWMKAPR